MYSTDYTTLRPAPTGSTNVSTHYTDITFQFTTEQISDFEANATVKSKGTAFSNALTKQETLFVPYNTSEGSGATHTHTLTTHSPVDTTLSIQTTVVMQTTTAVSMTTHKGTETTQHFSTQPSEHTTNNNKTTAQAQTTTVPAQTTTEPAQTTTVPAQTTTVPAQTTSTAVSTGDHTTAEGATTELSPTHVPTVENTTKEAVGCPYYYDWCFNTPAILLWQFLLGTFFVAVGYPVCNVMSYTIYSKILGPKPQVCTKHTILLNLPTSSLFVFLMFLQNHVSTIWYSFARRRERIVRVRASVAGLYLLNLSMPDTLVDVISSLHRLGGARANCDL